MPTAGLFDYIFTITASFQQMVLSAQGGMAKDNGEMMKGKKTNQTFES